MATHTTQHRLLTDTDITASASTTTPNVAGVHGGPATMSWVVTQTSPAFDIDYSVSYDGGTSWTGWKELTNAATTDNEFGATATGTWNAIIIAVVDAPLYRFRVEETGGANNITDLELVLTVTEDV
jgi:hypothetical protein